MGGARSRVRWSQRLARIEEVGLKVARRIAETWKSCETTTNDVRSFARAGGPNREPLHRPYCPHLACKLSLVSGHPLVSAARTRIRDLVSAGEHEWPWHEGETAMPL